MGNETIQPIEAVAEESLNFNIDVFASFRITENIEILITETTVNTWIIMGLLVLLGIIVRIKSNKWDPLKKPTGLQNVIELAIEAWEKFFRSNSSDRVIYLAPWFFSLFAFLFVSNIIGITGLRPPTADWGMTFPLAFSTFLLIIFAGMRHRPKAYLKSIFLEPFFLFAPLNIIGELARPISLSFRMFGNVLGGMILLSLLYGLAPYVSRFILPAPIHMYFDLVAGALQAVIFVVLSITFVGVAAED
ncbi:MAG: F0F1 ATP synthase subunit A [Defluviitaleaceae bacterium]|nr:F0F1 ATP synthase subunit A [Defluviitaleaceae bacterium]